jgi:ribosomal protein S12 methylthiotransferase accessory factor
VRLTARSALPQVWWPFAGRKLGIVRALSYLSDDPEDLDLYHVLPTVTSLGSLLGDTRKFEPRAGGAGLTLGDACNRAMGELLERYAALTYDQPARITATHKELCNRGCSVVPVEMLALYSRDQLLTPEFAQSEFTEDTRVSWFEGNSLIDGSLIQVPAQLVALGYMPGPSEMAKCFYATSSGCAVGNSLEAALLGGLLECIERDAFVIRWYAQQAPPTLQCDPWDLLGRRRQSHDLEIRLHDMTVDGSVPVICATCVDRSGRDCFFVLGLAANLDARTAARKAMIELGQGRPFVKTLASLGEAPDQTAKFNNFDVNVRFFGDSSNAKYIEWFLENQTVSPLDCSMEISAKNPEARLRILLERCATMNLSPIAFDTTTPEMVDTGLFAVKVVVPELVPLCIPSAPFLGHPRLARFMAESELNGHSSRVPHWVPHPFP